MKETHFDVGDTPDELVRIPTFYEILEVAETADDFEIDHAFARFLQETEPEVRDTAARKHAWEVLRDPINRSFYDEHLAQIRTAPLEGPDVAGAGEAAPELPPLG